MALTIRDAIENRSSEREKKLVASMSSVSPSGYFKFKQHSVKIAATIAKISSPGDRTIELKDNIEIG